MKKRPLLQSRLVAFLAWVVAVLDMVMSVSFDMMRQKKDAKAKEKRNEGKNRIYCSATMKKETRISFVCILIFKNTCIHKVEYKRKKINLITNFILH